MQTVVGIEVVDAAQDGSLFQSESYAALHVDGAREEDSSWHADHATALTGAFGDGLVYGLCVVGLSITNGTKG